MTSKLKVDLTKISKFRAKMILEHLKSSIEPKAGCKKHASTSDWCMKNH